MVSAHNGSVYSSSSNQMERNYSTKPEMCSVIRCSRNELFLLKSNPPEFWLRIDHV